jgi:hypothetical protein
MAKNERRKQFVSLGFKLCRDILFLRFLGAEVIGGKCPVSIIESAY